METIEVTCPRCGSKAQERFYGPCSNCRNSLRAEIYGEKKNIEAVAYEPKMNVVPNQVATKE